MDNKPKFWVAVRDGMRSPAGTREEAEAIRDCSYIDEEDDGRDILILEDGDPRLKDFETIDED